MSLSKLVADRVAAMRRAWQHDITRDLMIWQ